jgi:hypothetical protein
MENSLKQDYSLQKEEKTSILDTIEGKESIEKSPQETVDVFIKGIRTKKSSFFSGSCGEIEKCLLFFMKFFSFLLYLFLFSLFFLILSLFLFFSHSFLSLSLFLSQNLQSLG